MARSERKIWDRMLGAVPEDDQPVTIETQAVDAMRLATDNAALEHEVAQQRIALRRFEHENDELRVNNELLTEENETLRRDLADVNERALPNSISIYRRMVEQDKTDQPREDELLMLCAGCHANVIPRDPEHELCKDCDENGRPDLAVWQDVVTPSSNGTT
jgi:hypothetical protein